MAFSLLLHRKSSSLIGRTLVVGLGLLWHATAFGQATSDGLVDIDRNSKISVDESPFVTARAAGMANAVSPVADSTEAPFFNPAGIGFEEGKSTHKGWVKQLDFPYVAGAANDNSLKLMKDYQDSGVKENKGLVTPILDSTAGKRHYARVSAFPNLILGKLMVGAIQDQQFASVAQGEGTNKVSAHYRSVSGIGAGMSVSDPKGRISIGAFGTFLDRKDTSGEFDFLRVIDKDTRKDELDGKTTKTSGAAIHAGMIWRIADKGDPRFSAVVRDAGNTHYKAKDETQAEVVVNQDVTLGFSIGPQIGHSGKLNIIVEGNRLTDKYTAVTKKFRTGAELLLGTGQGRPTFSLRTGYNLAGVSGGLGLDLGLVGVQYANQAVDVGIDNVHVIERRHVGVFVVNVAEY